MSSNDSTSERVKSFVDSHPRPNDPRQIGDVTVKDAFDKWHHKHQGFYGKEVDGELMGPGYPSGDQASVPAQNENSGG